MTASKHQADLHASYAAWRITYQSSEQAARAAYARVQELEAQLESIGAGGVTGPLIDQPQAMPDISALTERGAKAWAGVDAQGLRDNFTAADMATASAQGFRDGVASLAASAGSEPVAWRAQFDAWWARNRVSTHQVKNIGGFAAKVWHAAIQTVVGATDSTAGFYPADEGSNPSRQATNSSPPEGMVGGWRPIETAPKDGTRILLHPSVEVHDSWSKGHWSEPQECWIVGGSASGVAHTYWLPLPPAPPTTTAGSGKGE